MFRTIFQKLTPAEKRFLAAEVLVSRIPALAAWIAAFGVVWLLAYTAGLVDGAALAAAGR